MEVDNYICDLIRSYYNERGLVFPNQNEAFLFLVSEVGELSDALVSNSNKKWVRNNPGKEISLYKEAGDVLMMFYVFCILSGIDPVYELKQKMKLKGFDTDDFDNNYIG